MRRIVLVLAVLVALAAAPAFTAESWVEVKGPDFVVLSDAGEKDARRVLLGFVQLRSLLKEAWPWARLDLSRPVVVLALRDETSYGRLVPAVSEDAGLRPVGAGGLFVVGPDRYWAAVRVNAPRFREDDPAWTNPQLPVFHDYLHVVLRHNFENPPAWLEEGLCEFWGNTVVIDGERVVVGLPIPPHVPVLRDRPLSSLSALMAMPRGASDFAHHGRSSGSTPVAQAWGLVHMLSAGMDGRAPQLARALEALRSGRPGPDALHEAFGDMAGLEREFESYARRAVFVSRTRPAVPDARAVTVREVSAAESLALRAGFLSAIGRGPEAAQLAGEAQRSDTNLSLAQEMRALVAWRAKRTDEALQACEAAVGLPNASDFAHYLLGTLIWQSSKAAAALERADGMLRRATEMNPAFARAYETQALVREAMGAPADQTMALVLRANGLEPGEIDYRLTALRLQARGGQVAQARARGEKLLAAVQGEERKRIETVLSEISDPGRLPPEAACNGGFGVACSLLGTQFRDGTGGVKDPVRAAAYFQKGCDAAHAGSCSSLGLAYEDGVGVTADLARAMGLYKKACDGGDRWACTRLAFALSTGDGVAVDATEAVRLLERSCAAQDTMACAKLGSMLRLGEGVAADQRRAETLLRQVCTAGSSWGCGELATLLVARGLPAEMPEAVKLFENACENDSASFCSMLAGLLELGKGVARDEPRARQLYRRACDRGYAPACERAGR